MVKLTIRVPDAKHERLRQLAKAQGISVNKLIDEFATIALAQHDALSQFQSARFRIRAAKGKPARGRALLDKLDAAFATNQ